MALSKAITGQGTIFNRNGVQLSEINSITGPGKSRETIEVTRLEDSDGYRQYIGGLRDPGTVTLNMNYTKEGYALLNGDFESNVPQNYEIVLPDHSNFEFKGLLTELPLTIPMGDKITVDVTIKISGPVTVDASS